MRFRYFFHESLDLRRELVGEVGDGTSPEWTLLEGSHVESCDYAEVVPTASECLEEVWVFFGIGIHHLPGC